MVPGSLRPVGDQFQTEEELASGGDSGNDSYSYLLRCMSEVCISG